MFLNKRFSSLTSYVFLLILATGMAILYFTVAKAEKIADQWSAMSSATVGEISDDEALIRTLLGDIKVELLKDKAPKTVDNFIKLAKSGFYDNTKFHRVIENFMIQGGDPNSKGDNKTTYGLGGPGYQFDDEISDEPLVRGIVAMANSGPNTNGSQFFIITAAETPWLQGKHTAFGKVISGMDIVDKISRVARDGDDVPLHQVIVEKIILR